MFENFHLLSSLPAAGQEDTVSDGGWGAGCHPPLSHLLRVFLTSSSFQRTAQIQIQLLRPNMDSGSPLLQTEPHYIPSTSQRPLDSSLSMILGLFPTPRVTLFPTIHCQLLDLSQPFCSILNATSP